MVVFSEKTGNLSLAKPYKISLISSRKIKLEAKCKANKTGFNLFPFLHEKWTSLCNVLLPIGYPDSVSEDYLAYQFWDTIQEICHAVTGCLRSAAILKANLNQAILKNGGEVIINMTLITLLQNVCKKIGPIYFSISNFGPLDSHHKQWRLVADLLVNLCTLIDILTLVCGSFYLIPLICCFSSLIESIGWAISSSTRAPILQHFSKSNNSVDVATKENCQHCCVKLIFLLIAYFLGPQVAENNRVIFLGFLVFAAGHLYANYRAQAALKMVNLNEQRLLLCCNKYLKYQAVPLVNEANEMESVIFGFGLRDKEVCGYNIKLGVSLANAINEILVDGGSNETIEEICANRFSRFEGKCFIILPNECRKQMNIILKENIYIDPNQIFEAYVRAVFTAYQLTHSKKMNSMDFEITEQLNTFKNLLDISGFNTKNVALKLSNCLCSFSKLNEDE